MAAKSDLKVKAAQIREEMAQTGKLVLRAPALVRAAEYLIRFTLGAVLAGAEIFGGYAPFGLSMVGCSGSGLDGFSALLGACFGYLSFRGLTDGLRYVAAAILIFSVAFAFFDIRLYKRTWFMPVVSALLSGATGFVYLGEEGWEVPARALSGGADHPLGGVDAHHAPLRHEHGQPLRQRAIAAAEVENGLVAAQ